jgi:integrase/recombinase XerD
MTLGRQLELRGDHWRLHFDASETKQGEILDLTWPEGLVVFLERYLTVHREQLLKACADTNRPTQALWVSQRGTAMGSDAIAFQINDRTREEFGTAINPHTFRHIAATTIATANPQGAQDIMAVLGHSSMAASEKHYNRAGSIGAGAALHKSIAKLRKEKLKPALPA